MTRTGVVLAIVAGAVVVAALTSATPTGDQPAAAPELIDVRSGALTLRAQVWRPSGSGRFPAVLFNHGSYGTDDPLPPSEPETLGPLFAHHGYVFLWLHRQGTGMSSGKGTAGGDQMAHARRAKGAEGRNRVQLQLLEHDELDEATAALARLRGRADVDAQRIGVVGHSFGGSLSLVMAARDPAIRAAVIFGGAAGSWDQSPALRQRLLAAVGRISAPVFFVHAKNDYSTAPGSALAAEMRRLGKPCVLKIYPPFGADSRAGHNLIFRSVQTWESDVLTFLDEHLRH
jgi:dienelactone hydrolase